MALALLTEAPIDSLDDDDKPARLLNTHWDTTVQEEIETHAWHFAVSTADITGTDLGTASGTLNWKFEPPADFLAFLPVGFDDQFEPVPIDWKHEGGFLYTDQSSPQHIRYIAYVDDPAEWPAWFVTLIAAALAVKIAHALTGKQSMIDVARAGYDRASVKAQRANKKNSGRLYRESWHLARGDTRFWRP